MDKRKMQEDEVFQLLLVIIYTVFISLGFLDALLGSAWPSMYRELYAGISYAGIIGMIITGGTIVFSFFSDSLIRKLGTGAVTATSVATTAAVLMGLSGSHTFPQLCLWEVLYGLGAGGVDVALNNLMALHHESRHISWFHCFWGIGVTVGPHVMGLCLINGLKRNHGCMAVGVIQIVLVICSLISLPLWKAKTDTGRGMSEEHKGMNLRNALRFPGARGILTVFFCYCALETTTGLWASSYMVSFKGISTDTAAKWTSLFYLDIAAGRLANGLVIDRLGDKTMVWIGQLTVFSGVVSLTLPLGHGAALAGLVFTGLGCAPIYPSMLHQTSNYFGAENPQSIIGLQTACAYMGSTFMPPLPGLSAELISVRIYPFYLMVLVCLTIIMTERAGKIHTDKPDRLTHAQPLQ